MTASPRHDVTGRPVALREVDLDRFFHPRTVAVIGATDAPGPGHQMWRRIHQWGDRHGATVIPVNPGRASVGDVATVATITDIDGEIDLAVILTADAVDLFEEILEHEPAFAVIFGAGFAEAGPDGRRLQERLAGLVDRSQTRLLGPNTNLNAFETFRTDLAGPSIALITQSGHQGRPVFQAQELGIAVSHWAPTGNEVDLELADFVAYFAGLDEVGAIVAYVEGFKDGRSFMLAADRAARARVPIVIVKVGRTAEGSSMAHSHTGHLAGNDRVTDAAFRQFGIIRVDGLDELTDTGALLARAAPPVTDGVCVYGISGGTGAHMADLCAAAGLKLTALAPATQDRLRRSIPDYLHVANPVDCGGPPVMDERGREILDGILDDDGIGVLICPITGALPTMSEPLARDLVAVAADTDKPVCVVSGSPLLDDSVYTDVLLDSPVHVFRTFANCVGAVSAYVDYHRFAARYRSPFDQPVPARPTPPWAIESVLGAASSLSEYESKQLLSAYGIDVPREHLCRSATDAAKAARQLGFPVVMKVSSREALHKSELGLVALDIGSIAQVRRTYGELGAAAEREGVPVEGILVAEQITDGIETVIGVTHDEVFGPAVMFGTGGVFAEVLDDVAFRVPPFDRRDARRMNEETRGSALLGGHRGRAESNVEALVDAIMALQHLAVDQATYIAEIDVNPLIVTGDRAVALDALVVARAKMTP
jgi:acyl-CoA synthetase (NDP forming)